MGRGGDNREESDAWILGGCRGAFMEEKEVVGSIGGTSRKWKEERGLHCRSSGQDIIVVGGLSVLLPAAKVL